MTAEIIIAIHKPCAIPTELTSDGAYIPLFVGAANSKPLYIKGTEVIRPEGKIPDGFSPVRRDDSGAYDIIVPKKRRYYIESLYSHYANTLEKSHLDEALSVIKERHPEYEKAAIEAYSRTWGYMFNMFVMKRDCFRDYCDFLFDILFELEKRNLPGSNGSAFERRLYGRVSEILFNVWLVKHSELSLFEVTVKSPERVNWIKKGGAFLSAKFFKKKYKESF